MVKTKMFKKREALLKRDLEGQKTEALGAENRYYAGESLGYNPDDKQCFFHYIENGGPANWRMLHPWPRWYKGKNGRKKIMRNN